jgi:hypothetical protein
MGMHRIFRALAAVILLFFPVILFFGFFSTHSFFNEQMNRFLSHPAASRAAEISSFFRYTDSGTVGMELVSFTANHVLFSLLQGLVIPVFLLITGFVLLKYILANEIYNLPFSLVIGFSVLMGSVSVSVVSLLFQGFAFRGLLSLVFTGSLLILAANEFACLSTLFRNAYSAHLKPMQSFLFAALLVYFVWLITVPLSPYPSLLSVGLGDMPAYCTAAINMLGGKGLTEDYFIADLFRGTYGYLTTSSSLPVLCLSFFYRIFGSNVMTGFILFAFMGAVAAYVLADFVRRHSSNLLWAVMVGMLLLLRPLFFQCMGLGVVSNMAALSFALAIAVYDAGFKNGRANSFLLLMPLACALAIRPESAFFSALIMGTEAVRGYYHFRLAPVLKWAIPFSFLFVIGSAARVVPALIPSCLSSLSILQVQFASDRNEFAYPFRPWCEYNHMLCRRYLNGRPLESTGSPVIIEDAVRHPIEFGGYLIRQIQKANTKAGSLFFGIGSQVGTFVLLSVLIFLPDRLRWFAAAGVAYIVLLPCLNIAASDRHYFPVIMVLETLFFYGLTRIKWMSRVFPMLKSSWICVPFLLVSAEYFVFGTKSIVEVRRDNTSYVDALKDMQTVMDPNLLVVSSYPQLITCMTGARKVMGGTFLTENLTGLVKTFRPDYVLLDNLRDGPRNPSYFIGCPFAAGMDYRPLLNCSGKKYTLFKRVD